MIKAFAPIPAVLCLSLSITIGGGVIGISESAQAQQVEATVPLPLAPISKEREAARRLYARLTGIPLPIDNYVLVQMEELIQQQRLQEAAQLATQSPDFYNLVVRDFAAKMSTREETEGATLNDFIATVIGVTRDDINAKELLVGNFFYMATDASVPRDLADDVLRSNNHYEALEEDGLSLHAALEKVDGQKMISGSDAVVDMPDPAGLLTTRAFMEAHATAGTNRRLVEYAFREFLCAPIKQWADADASDYFVGRDVDRAPGGEVIEYKKNCKACHSPMDAMRGAFAQFDFENGRIKNTQFYNPGRRPNELEQSSEGVVAKMNQNNDVFANGYVTRNASWMNLATKGSNASQFGWRGALKGVGVQQFGRMLANSQAFSSCMVKRVFESVCQRPVTAKEQSMVNHQAQKFEADGYRLKALFERVATHENCMGRVE